jgi:hypothetical protein
LILATEREFVCDDQAVARECERNAGFDDHLLKPIDFPAL